jgi:hypothetical protein
MRLSIAVAAVASIGAMSALTSIASAAEGTTCSGNTGKLTFSPGLTNESAKVQNIVAKGVLTGCTGSVTEAKYVAHVKTTNAATCSTLLAPGETATGSLVIKWKPKGQGNSQASITVTGTGGGATIEGTVESGLFAGSVLSGSLESLTPVFTGKGEPCTKKNKLKKATYVGSSLTIA